MEGTNDSDNHQPSKQLQTPIIDGSASHRQHPHTTPSANDTPQGNSVSRSNTNTQDKNIKNMHFLQTSWENLADQELENECHAQLLSNQSADKGQTIESDADIEQDEPYQLVTRRKKHNKQTSNVRKSTFNTRSKVVHTNLSN